MTNDFFLRNSHISYNAYITHHMSVDWIKEKLKMNASVIAEIKMK